MNRPIAITCGDPKGIGPEITVKAWERLRNELNFVLFTSYDFMVKKFPDIPFELISDPEDAQKIMNNGLPIIDLPFQINTESTENTINFSNATIKSIQMATEYCMKGMTSALCTNPINKYVLSAISNFDFSGHTDYLKHLTGSKNVVMLLASKELRVIPLTTHVAIKDVSKLLSKKLIKTTIDISHQSLIKLFNIPNPRIVVTGLNPHSGENGMFGSEEIDLIIPSINEMALKNINVTGPFSADSLFHKNARGNYDVAICMYHDQALIPIKTIDFEEAVNVTLGLPFIRTSPDHGTAIDIVDKGLASPSSLISAIRMAEQLSKNNK